VDVLRRTRRNADTIRGAAPDLTIERAVAVRVGARPYRISILKYEFEELIIRSILREYVSISHERPPGH
jgi:hypothetical protein